MRVYVRYDKDKDLWYVTAKENYAGMLKTTAAHLPCKKDGIGAAAIAVVDQVTEKRNTRLATAAQFKEYTLGRV